MHGSFDVVTRVRPYRYEPGCLWLLDQRKLPFEEIWLECPGVKETVAAIRSLAVRGAPLIGVAAAFGLVAEAFQTLRANPFALEEAVSRGLGELASARPTAVNLPAAMARMRTVWEEERSEIPDERVAALERAALDFAEEDRKACLAIGQFGAFLLEGLLGEWRGGHEESGEPRPLPLLTHCNAGALATAGVGTALGIVRAVAARRNVTVFSDETRPFFQGARLTAWELLEDGIPVTVLPDSAAASLIAAGRIAAVIAGADRIAATGDVANKVGTYPLALACHRHGVPFIVAAPTTTLDLSIGSGKEIPIEMREAAEVLEIPNPYGPGLRIAPRGASALYPAFDVTPSDLITAIVTEKGVALPPFLGDLKTFAADALRGRK